VTQPDRDPDVTVACGLDLLLCALDAASGRARFGPRLSYALPVAELADLEAARRVSVRADGPVRAAAARLIAVPEDPVPARLDVAFAVLADAARVARPHLRGWDHRKHRARLRRLRRQAVRGDAGRLLREGRRAIAMLSGLAPSDSRTIDPQIGLIPNARRAVMRFRLLAA
jgi:hypothetical protein